MNRRSLLTLLGLAPVAVATGAMTAAQKPNPLSGYASGIALTGERGPELVNIPASGVLQPTTVELRVDTKDLEVELRRMCRKMERQSANHIRRNRRLRTIT